MVTFIIILLYINIPIYKPLKFKFEQNKLVIIIYKILCNKKIFLTLNYLSTMKHFLVSSQ